MAPGNALRTSGTELRSNIAVSETLSKKKAVGSIESRLRATYQAAAAWLKHYSHAERIVVLSLLLASIGALVFLWKHASPQSKEDLKLTLAKDLIQFLVILLLGAFVAEAFKRADQRRREEESFATIRDEIRKRLDECYQRAKKCRSGLRSAGLNREICLNPAFDERCRNAYCAELERLNEIQLDLEKIWHEIDALKCAFTRSSGIIKRVQVMSGFLRRLIDEYETNWCVLVKREEALQAPQFKYLQHLVGSSTEGWFKEKFCDRYSEAVELIRLDGFHVNI